MNTRRRGLGAIVFIVLASSCVPETATEANNPVDCQRGYYESPTTHACILRPDVVIITMSPSGNCPDFSPRHASVRTGQSFMFQNNTTTSFTIMIRNRKVDNSAYPLTTVAPGKLSAAFSYNIAGEWSYYAPAPCSTLEGITTVIVTVG